MLLQEYLRSGKDIKDLFINRYEHPTMPLIGFKYDLLDSPKYDNVVQECRGVVLDKNTLEIVAKGFNRFYTLGENPDLNFDWSNFITQEKVDGSLILMYNYQNNWRINTSGTFGEGKVGLSNKTWNELFFETANLDLSKFDKRYTYVFELYTAHNAVVRSYEESCVFLLSIFCGESELPLKDTVCFAETNGLKIPMIFDYKNLEQIKEFLKEKEQKDKTYEGFVLRDINNNRIKIKTETYVALHNLLDNGNLFNPKRIVPLVLNGELDEVLSIFSKRPKELLDNFHRVAKLVEDSWVELLALWHATVNIESQKEYAMRVKNNKFSGLLFDDRKRNKAKDVRQFRTLWLNSSEFVTKVLFPK